MLFPSEKLPTKPAKACSRPSLRDVVIATTDRSSDLESQDGINPHPQMPAQKLPWWSRYGGYHPIKKTLPQSRVRRLVLTGLFLVAVVVVAVVVGLFKAGRLSHLPLFSKASKSSTPPSVTVC